MGAVVAGCTPGSSGARVPSFPGTEPSASLSSAPAGPPDWEALRSRLSGRLVLSGESAFESAKRGFNPFFDDHAPVAVAQCATPEDVQACVSAAARRVPIAARSGGHSYAGYSSPDHGLVVDLGRMSTVELHGDQVVVGAGARLKDVYAALGAAGRCLPAGTCPTVGIAGLTLGGGIGVLTRQYGLTCDRLLSARIVTADGTARTASADSESELFWALRGGGGGNFGIVTSFTFATDPAPEVAVFALRFPGGSADDVAGAWQSWIPRTPSKLWSNLVLTSGSPVKSRVGGCFVGDAGALNPLLDDLVRRAGATPVSRSARQMDYAGAMRYFAGGEDRESFIASSRIIGKPVDPARLTGTIAGKTGVDLLIDSLGGAVSRMAPSDTAFWHRGALASVQVFASATAGNRDAVTRTVGGVVAGLAAAGAEGAYVNYLDPALPDWMNAYYGGNATRLQRVARTYDPLGVFRFAQGVTP